MTRPIRTLTLTALAVLALAGFPGPAAGQVPADSASASMETRPSTHGPDRARLLLSSSAQPLQRGEGYVAGHLVIFPLMAYGVTDWLTVAGGGSLFPGLMGGAFYVAPRLTLFSRTGLDLAIGSVMLLLEGEGVISTLYKEKGGGTFGALYGVGTFSGSHHAVTAGAGWGYEIPNSRINATGGSHVDLRSQPVMLLALQSRLIQPFEILTENWLGSRNGNVNGLLTGGVRSLGRAGSTDLALGMRVRRGKVECCIPIVNFALYFGR